MNVARKGMTLLAGLVAVVGLAAASGATASASATTSAPLIAYWNGTSWTQQTAPNPGGSGMLTTVSAVSPTDVWALGSYGSEPASALAEHWNGLAWLQMPMPLPSGATEIHFTGMSALSSTDIWAVGAWDNGSPGAGFAPLIEHWNGRAWSVVTSPVLPTPKMDHGAQLYGVSAVSASDAWAVGYTGMGTQHNLILHWNGTSWKHVKAPSMGSLSVLSGLTAISASKVWAVGTLHFKYYKHEGAQGFALRWNGKAWQKMRNTHAGSLLAVTGTKNDLWAVGDWNTRISGGGKNLPLIEQYNGRHWKNFRAPGYSGSARQPLSSIAMLSGNDLWAVGYHTDKLSLQSQTLVEHFANGAWHRVPSMNPAKDDWFSGVSAASPTDVWAVGTYFPGS